MSRNDKEKATPEGKERAGSEMRMSTPQLVRIRLILKCQALFCSLNATAVISKLGPFFFETRSHCVTQTGLELIIFLPQPPKGWSYRHVLP